MTKGSLMKIKNISECSPWSILHYFLPALNDNWSLKPIFGNFESGCCAQVLLFEGKLLWTSLHYVYRYLNN